MNKKEKTEENTKAIKFSKGDKVSYEGSTQKKKCIQCAVIAVALDEINPRDFIPFFLVFGRRNLQRFVDTKRTSALDQKGFKVTMKGLRTAEILHNETSSFSI